MYMINPGLKIEIPKKLTDYSRSKKVNYDEDRIKSSSSSNSSLSGLTPKSPAKFTGKQKLLLGAAALLTLAGVSSVAYGIHKAVKNKKKPYVAPVKKYQGKSKSPKKK